MLRLIAALLLCAAALTETALQRTMRRRQPADVGHSANSYPRGADVDFSGNPFENMTAVSGMEALPNRGDRGRKERRRQQTEALYGELGVAGSDEEGAAGGHWLDHNEVSGIMTVECLELRQKDPRDPCTKSVPVQHLVEVVQRPGPLNMGSYPSWRDPRCHSNGALFCDPEGLLQSNLTVAKAITDALLSFKASTRVTCGEVESKVVGDPSLEHSRPFNLGVAVADDWPESEMDASSLQKFGDLLMTQWGMLPFYNGVDAQNGLNPPISPSQAETNCPNAAVLIILPAHHEIYLASPGCQFICYERMGDMINTAMLAALEDDGLAAAIHVGIHEVGQVLHAMTPQAMENFGARTYFRRRPSIRDKWLKSEYAWICMVRLVFLLVVCVFLYVVWFGCEMFFAEPLRTNIERSAAAAAQKARKPR